MADRAREAPDTPPPNASAAAIALGGLIALAVAMGIGRFAFTPILPMMQQEAALSVAAGGWLASANYLGYLLGALSAVGANVPAARAIRAGLLLIAATTFAMGLGQNFTAWMVLRVLAGIGSAWVLVYVSAWSLSELARRGRPRLSGIVFAGVGIGITAAGLVCLALMYVRLGADAAWMAFGLLSLLLALAIWPLFGAHAGSARATSAPPATAPRRWNRASIRLVLCYGAFGFGYIIPATFLPAMAQQYIADPAIFGWSWPLFGAAAAASTLALAGLRRFASNRGLWIASHLVMALGVVLPVLWPGIIAILLAALLVGGTFMVATMTAIQEAREVGGTGATRLIAAMTAAFAVGQILGPIGAGFASAATGSLSAALLVASLLLAAGAYGLTGGRRTRDRRDAPATEER